MRKDMFAYDAMFQPEKCLRSSPLIVLRATLRCCDAYDIPRERCSMRDATHGVVYVDALPPTYLPMLPGSMSPPDAMPVLLDSSSQPPPCHAHLI